MKRQADNVSQKDVDDDSDDSECEFELEDSDFETTLESENEEEESPSENEDDELEESGRCETIKKRTAESDFDQDNQQNRRKQLKTDSSQRSSSSEDKEEEDSDSDGINNEQEESVLRGRTVKWTFLQHKGPVFAPAYERLPQNVHFKYNEEHLRLSQNAEEIAGFYAPLISQDHPPNEQFRRNFLNDWRNSMTEEEQGRIEDLEKCDFTEINEFYKMKKAERDQMSKEEKDAIKKEKEAIHEEYGYCVIDGRREEIANFRVEPPILFRGRGDNPKVGMLKKRVLPEDVTINCSKDSEIPRPPEGHTWKAVCHDNTVMWLARWEENIQGEPKYINLHQASKLKSDKDEEKYEKARDLAGCIDNIRDTYKKEFKSKEEQIAQRAVALYFIDKLALRAGNEKGADQADTVGCCSLRCEHIKLHDRKNGRNCVVVFDFLGKDSIPYKNEVAVAKQVYQNLKIFKKNKRPGDHLFDKLNSTKLNQYLSGLMEGLTAKVFRTYNASHVLQEQLDELTPKNGTPAEKVSAFNRANLEVARLCNHQKAIPKNHQKMMEKLDERILKKRAEIEAAKKRVKDLGKKSRHGGVKSKVNNCDCQLKKLERTKTEKEEGKNIALGTSKLNYLDPRIIVAWCKKWNVPLSKVYSKALIKKFHWAIETDEDFRFD